MPKRDPKEPWLHEATGYWCKKVAGELLYLDKDYKTAKQKLAAHLRDAKRKNAGASQWLDVSFGELCDEFLDDVKDRKGEGTYKDYRWRLLRALKLTGKAQVSTVRVGEFRRFHLAKVERALNRKKLSPTSVKDTLATIQAVFTWAVENDMFDVNPVVGYEKPAARSRSRTVTADEFQALLKAQTANLPFRRVLIALRETGCRPKEVRNLKWEYVDLEQRVWILPEHKSITRQKQPHPRIIPLTDTIWKLCMWLDSQPKIASGHVFVNCHRKPYTKDRFCKAMERSRKRAGITLKAGEQLVLYSNRHTFATDAVGQVTDLELAELLGHSDLSTIKRYTHISSERLKEIRQRVQRRRTG